MPQADTWLNANDRGITRNAAMARSARVATWRNSARVHAGIARLPKGLGRVEVIVTVHPLPGRRRGFRDLANLHPTAKAVVDGLKIYGLVPDDNDRHFVGPHLFLGDTSTKLHAVLDIQITDLTRAPAAVEAP